MQLSLREKSLINYNAEELLKNISIQGATFDTKATKTNILFNKIWKFSKHVFIYSL